MYFRYTVFMRATIDIPNAKYREIKTLAAQRGTTVRQLVLDGLELVSKSETRHRSRRLSGPILPATGKHTINPTEEQLVDAFFLS
jgi:hypothetical protein